MSQITQLRKGAGAPNPGQFDGVTKTADDITLAVPAALQPMPAPMDLIQWGFRKATVVHVDDRTAVVKFENGDLEILSDKDLGLDSPLAQPGEVQLDQYEFDRQAAAAAKVPTPVDLPETLRQRRGHVFYPKAEMRKWPALYATEHLRVGDKKIVAHYFAAGDDWYIAEVEHETGLAFGYTKLHGHGRGEWGYISLPELEKQTRGPFVYAERDCHFSDRGKLAREILPSSAWAYADED